MDRRRHLFAAGVLLLAAAYALPLPDAPVGDEATYLLAAGSLWHDRDLRFGPGDLARGYRIWSAGPRAVALVETGGSAEGSSLVFGRPFLYPALAAPGYGLLGPRGLRVLNMGLLLAMLWVSWRRFVEAPGGEPGAGAGRRRRAGLLVAGFFFASAAAIHVLRLGPEVLLMACVFFAVALWCRVRGAPLWGWRELLPLAAAGALLAAAAVSEPLLALLALPVAADLLWSRRLWAAGVFAAALLLAGLVLAGLQVRLAGAWGPELAERARSFAGPFPLEVRPAAEEPDPREALLPEPFLEAGAPAAPAPGLRLRQAGWRLFWLGAGRHAGVLPYLPFALFAAGLYLADLARPGGRSRHLLAAALLVYAVLAVLGVCGSFAEVAAPGAGPATAPGPRALALVYPVFLFLPRSLRGGRALLLPFAAAGLWTAPALAVAASGLGTEHLLELPARGPAYRGLPLELELLAEGRLPGYAAFDRFPRGQGGLWLVPRETFFIGERHPDGVWLRGASRSEVILVARAPVAAVRFRARSIAADSELTVTGAGDRLRARFDTPGKRAGVPVAVRPRLVARGLGLFLRAEPEQERIYRLVLEVTGGAVPAGIDPRSADPRYLGVFLQFEPEAGSKAAAQ